MVLALFAAVAAQAAGPSAGYLLSYAPTGVAREGWHRLAVKVRGHKGTVRSRSGYFMPARSTSCD